MNTLYDRFVSVIEQKISPLAGRLGQQKYIQAIRDGFIAALPFMIVGSFMLVFIFPPSRKRPSGALPGPGLTSPAPIRPSCCCRSSSAWG